MSTHHQSEKHSLPARLRRILFGVAATVAASAGLPTSADAQLMQLIAAGPVEGLAVTSEALVWKFHGCDPNYPSDRSFVRSLPAVPARGLLGALPPNTIYSGRTCNLEDVVASRNVVVNRTHAFWVTGDGSLVRMPLNRSRTTPEVLIRHASSAPTLTVLALAGAWIAWTDGAGVYRTRTSWYSGSRPIATVMRPGSVGPLVDLVPMGDGYVLRGRNRIWRLVRFGSGFWPVELRNSSRTTAFAVADDRIFLALARPEGWEIGWILPDFSYVQLFSDLRTDARVDQMAAVPGGSLFFHIHGPDGTGPLMRWWSGSPRQPITPDIRMLGDSRLAIGPYLFWASSDGLMRMSLARP